VKISGNGGDECRSLNFHHVFMYSCICVENTYKLVTMASKTPLGFKRCILDIQSRSPQCHGSRCQNIDLYPLLRLPHLDTDRDVDHEDQGYLALLFENSERRTRTEFPRQSNHRDYSLYYSAAHCTASKRQAPQSNPK